MYFIRTLFTLMLVNSFLSCHSQQNNHKGKMNNKPTLMAEIDDWKMENKNTYLVIKTTLTNNSADTISYMSMSCSWQELYWTDTKQLAIVINECGENGAVLIKIAPYSKEINTLELMTQKNTTELNNLKFKIGFNFITAHHHDRLSTKVMQLEKMENVIWSNTLQLKK